MGTGEIYVGAHVSTRGGYGRAARAAALNGASSFQYFPKNPRSLQLKPFDSKEAAACASYCREHGIRSIAHSPYPTNLAAAPEGREGTAPRSAVVSSLLNDLEIAEGCGSVGVVVHFGHFQGGEPLQGYRNIIQCINEVLAGWNGACKLLLENQAGAGHAEGTTLEELTKIRELCGKPESIGYCLDTCHAFAAGIWDPGQNEAFLDRGDRLGFWDHLVAVHVNDSRYPFGSRKDRHAVPGTGYIGEAGLRGFLTSGQLKGAIAVLETDKEPDGTHRAQVAMIRKWFS